LGANISGRETNKENRMNLSAILCLYGYKAIMRIAARCRDTFLVLKSSDGKLGNISSAIMLSL
jgi:hypothetical protein